MDKTSLAFSVVELYFGRILFDSKNKRYSMNWFLHVRDLFVESMANTTVRTVLGKVELDKVTLLFRRRSLLRFTCSCSYV